MNLFESGWVKSAANTVVDGMNKALAMSPNSQKQLKNLEGCTLLLHLTGLDTKVYFSVLKSRPLSDEINAEQSASTYTVNLVNASEQHDVKITGSPIAFTKLLNAKNKAALFQADGFQTQDNRSQKLSLEGDAVRIQQILTFMGSLQIDWDGLLASFIGDVPAHLLGSSLRSGLMWGLNFSQSLIRDTEEFIKYELRLLPDKRRAQKQFSAIASLAEDLETLNARIDTLATQVNK